MTTRARLQALGLLDAAGNVTEAGKRWTDEQMERLRREAEDRGKGRRAVPIRGE